MSEQGSENVHVENLSMHPNGVKMMIKFMVRISKAL